jgi:hypothetical protein
VSSVIIRILLGFSTILTAVVIAVFFCTIIYLFGIDNIMVGVLLLLILGVCYMIGDEQLSRGK